MHKITIAMYKKYAHGNKKSWSVGSRLWIREIFFPVGHVKTTEPMSRDGLLAAKLDHDHGSASSSTSAPTFSEWAFPKLQRVYVTGGSTNTSFPALPLF